MCNVNYLILVLLYLKTQLKRKYFVLFDLKYNYKLEKVFKIKTFCVKFDKFGV